MVLLCSHPAGKPICRGRGICPTEGPLSSEGERGREAVKALPGQRHGSPTPKEAAMGGSLQFSCPRSVLREESWGAESEPDGE